MSLSGKHWQPVYTGIQDMSWFILKEDGFVYVARIPHLFLSLLLNMALWLGMSQMLWQFHGQCPYC